MAKTPRDAFTDLLSKLVRVPKREIDEQERRYQESRRREDERAPAREIVPPARRKTGR